MPSCHRATATCDLTDPGIPQATAGDRPRPPRPEYDRVRESCITALRARRNRPGGYRLAKDDPGAAQEAVTGSRPLADLRSVALLSNGAGRIVDPYGLTTWPGVMELVGADGPADVLRRVRQAEARMSAGPDAPVPDDATVAHCIHLPGGDAG